MTNDTDCLPIRFDTRGFRESHGTRAKNSREFLIVTENLSSHFPLSFSRIHTNFLYFI